MATGFECGIGLDAEDIAEGDVIECYQMVAEQACLGPMSQRTDRLDSQIRAELMELLQREMKDPRVGFATITRVETARDLGSAKVWVSVLGTPRSERDQR